MGYSPGFSTATHQLLDCFSPVWVRHATMGPVNRPTSPPPRLGVHPAGDGVDVAVLNPGE